MLKIFSVVGSSNSGKTTLIEKLIPEFIRRGYRVGTVKHASHGFEMDQKGKDSWRHLKAGADTVMISSPNQTAIVKRQSSENLAGLLHYMSDMDIVIIEGFKREKLPKIEVCPSRTGAPVCLEDDALFALVTDQPIQTHVPVFDLEDIDGIASLIERLD
ncbi:MAG: molybdopterin-guanine dinucleotide biosynthesis protein B [Desulfatirhabdiaceae bacterium]